MRYIIGPATGVQMMPFVRSVWHVFGEHMADHFDDHKLKDFLTFCATYALSCKC